MCGEVSCMHVFMCVGPQVGAYRDKVDVGVSLYDSPPYLLRWSLTKPRASQFA